MTKNVRTRTHANPVDFGLLSPLLATDYFHTTIKGGYVDGIFIPEILVRKYGIKHGDLCKLYGSPNNLTIEKMPATTTCIKLRPSKFKDIKNCVIELTELGDLSCSKTIDGVALTDFFDLACLPDLNKMPFTLSPNDLIDLRYSSQDLIPRPHVTWVHYDGQKTQATKGHAGLDCKRSEV